MLLTIQIIVGVIAYLAICFVLAKFCAINDMKYRTVKDKPGPLVHPLIAERRRGYDRRQRRAPIIYEHRGGKDRRRRYVLANQRGVTVVVVTILMATVLIPFMALAIDVGMMHVRKTEASVAADAVALGATNALYANEPRPEFYEPAVANAVAAELAAANGATCTHQLGHYNLQSRVFTPGALGNIPAWQEVTLLEVYEDTFFTNAVKVTCGVDDRGPISGINFNAGAVAIAIKRMAEAEPPDTGVELRPGSGLVQ